ncbi:MAG: hypothetical protein JSU72_08985 [Deltaproteobacteria bacterium]|nr:MAG: hypothetical protein JSU72_08985 [Deltaproteobacteria bacterium]
MYPFSYVFRKAESGEIIREGEGYILIHGAWWCLVRRWQDNIVGTPGQRMLIVDRKERRFEAEMRKWPEGSPGQRWNHWTCIRSPDPHEADLDLYLCEYYYPEGTDRVIHDSGDWVFYEDFSWNDNGLLESITRYKHSYVRYTYEGLKLKRIEFGRSDTIHTVAELTYK